MTPPSSRRTLTLVHLTHSCCTSRMVYLYKLMLKQMAMQKLMLMPMRKRKQLDLPERKNSRNKISDIHLETKSSIFCESDRHGESRFPDLFPIFRGDMGGGGCMVGLGASAFIDARDCWLGASVGMIG